MKRMITSAFSVALVAMATLVGCGDSAPVGGASGPDTPATITNGIVANLNAMAEIFNSVTDEASAKAAVPKIEATRANMRGVAARAKAMPKISKAEMDKFDAEAAKIMPGVMNKMMESRANIDKVFDKNPKVREIIEPALKGMENDM